MPLPFDTPLFLLINADATTSPWVIALAQGTSSILPFAMAGVLVGALARGDASTRRMVGHAIFSMLIAWCAVHLLRWAVPMARPAHYGLGHQWVAHGARAGFPSLHTAAAFALAMAAWRTLGTSALTLALWTCALLMGWSRICLGVHFPSDVMAGAMAGLLSGYLGGTLADRFTGLGKSSAYWSRRARP